jgi:hypothetical protein
MKGRPLIDLTGREYGRLRVLGRGRTEARVGKDGRPRGTRPLWRCLCDPRLGGCGAEVQVAGNHLRNDGDVTSCGCHRRDRMAAKGQFAAAPIDRVCRRCGESYVGHPVSSYCSPECRRLGRRERGGATAEDRLRRLLAWLEGRGVPDAELAEVLGVATQAVWRMRRDPD